jgi:hypothetical protein
MSYWDLSDGETVSTEKEYEAPSGGGNLILPEGSSVMASIDECKWQSFQGGEDHISIRWNILAPEEYQGRKIFQKLWPEGDKARNTDPEKARKKGDTAKRMIAAIDANCGGQIVKLGRKPTDEDFAMHLTNKPMVIRLGLWEMKQNDGTMGSGNWVQAVSPSSKAVSVNASKVTKAAPKQQTSSGGVSRQDMDDEIPF